MARRELFPVSDAARPESTARVENPAVRVDFDPGFFGLTVDQAAQVHPEQRLLLELAWEALEDAGIAPDRLAAERVRAEIDAHWDGRERLLFRTAFDFATRGGLSPSRTSISHTPNTRTPSTLAGRDTSHTDWPGRAMEEAAQLLTDGAATLVLAGSTDGRTGGFLVLRTLADADGNGERVRGVLQGSDIVDRPAAAPASLPAPESVPAAASALGAPTAHGAVPGLEVAPRAVPLVLSAAAAPALRRQAERLRDLLTPGEKAPEVPLARTGHALATTRATTLAHRAVLLARSAADARDSLTVLAAGGAAKGLVQGETTGPGQASERGGFGGAERVGESGEVVFVFPGHGPQREGMAAELLDTAPVFVRRMEECAQALEPFVDWSLLDVIRGRNGAPGMDRVDVSQPALWAVTVSLAALWESYGVRPAAIVGHSIGEWAAACVAGVLSLSDGARVAASWTRHLAGLVGRGDMAWVNLPEGEAAVRLASWPDRIWIAAVNGLQEVVVSGYPDAVADLLAELAADGIRARKLRLGLSAHTPHIDEILPPIAEELAGLAPRPATVPLHSSIPAHAMGPVSMTDAEYWRRCVREPVDFGAVCRELAADGKRFFVELSPHPTLVTAMAATFEEAGHDAVALGTLRRGHGDLETPHLSGRRLRPGRRGRLVGRVPGCGGRARGPAPVPVPTACLPGRRPGRRDGRHGPPRTVGPRHARCRARPTPRPLAPRGAARTRLRHRPAHRRHRRRNTGTRRRPGAAYRMGRHRPVARRTVRWRARTPGGRGLPPRARRFREHLTGRRPGRRLPRTCGQ
ncbi:acyltransferase domain-containing protein [Streptomyces leeuwenhoekii]|uniref:acyltransferase domain-containing protein n=1 Tax=Streptomyces leeuwenhoekii TaxID=1437453 RepID=UPI00065C96D6|nr:acyltransferase domain-containing protein [Streptomyces leeuwenhoekii]